MKRLFVAIKISPKKRTLEKYFTLKQALNYNKIKWVEPDKLHITIKFLGDTYEDSIPIVISVISSTIKETSSFKIELKNVGIFGSRYNPRVIWFGISENQKLKSLAEDLISNLDKNGFKRDRQNFVPHLTVGRIKRIEDSKLFNNEIEKLRDFYFQEIHVDSIILYESIILSQGPTYKIVKSFNLL
jgi:RNA 2',3'-cyclic 3'-phosphodiesterase